MILKLIVPWEHMPKKLGNASLFKTVVPRRTLAGFSGLRKQGEQDSACQPDLSNHKTLVRLAWRTDSHRFPHGVRKKLLSLRSILFGRGDVELKYIILFELYNQEVGARFIGS